MNKQGQSIVEYALIATLVLLGVIFMGPYVLRSINAHFQLWDEGSQDSFHENLRQASLNSIPYLNSDCECTQTTGQCGGPNMFCAANEKEIDWVCTPYQGCNGSKGTTTCVVDQDCCGCPSVSGCGAAALPTPATPGVTPHPPGMVSVPCPQITSGQACTYVANECYQALPITGTNKSPCYYGYRIYSFPCGSTSSSVCVPDTYDPANNINGCPLPQCTGSFSFPNSSVYCPNAQTGLTGDTQNTLVDKESCNCGSGNDCPQYMSCSGGNCKAPGSACIPCSGAPGTCQIYCVAPYAPNAQPTSTADQCTLHFVVAANSCAATTNFRAPCSSSCTGTSDCNECDCSTENASLLTHNQLYCYWYGSHHNCHTTINNQSFTVCSTGLPIAGVTVSPGYPVVNPTPNLDTVINNEGGNLCASPEGMPGDGCNIIVNWGNNTANPTPAN